MTPVQLSRPPVEKVAVDPEGRIPFELRIGVTGHRHLGDPAAVRAGLDKWVGELRCRFRTSDRTPIRFTVLTALAAGADRLVPEHLRATLGADAVGVHAVLPLTVHDYMSDFDGLDSRREFARLLAGAEARVDLSRAETLPSDERVGAYERAGWYIVDRCDVLISVWDGQEGHGAGGTAAVVAYADRHNVPVLVVPAPRPDPGPLMVRAARPMESTPRYEAARNALARLDEYNRPSVGSGHLAKAIAGSYLRTEVAGVADRRRGGCRGGMGAAAVRPGRHAGAPVPVPVHASGRRRVSPGSARGHRCGRRRRLLPGRSGLAGV